MDTVAGKLFCVTNGNSVTLFNKIGSGKGELINVPDGTLILVLGTSQRFDYDISKVLVKGRIYEVFNKHFFFRVTRIL